MDRFEGYGQSSSSPCCRDFSLPQSALGLFYETHETSLNSGFVPAALPLTHKHTHTQGDREYHWYYRNVEGLRATTTTRQSP